MGKTSSKLSLEQIDYLTNETCFNEKEIKMWYRDFRKECPKGGLNRDQFLQIFTAFHPNGDPSQFASHVFDAFDLNKNGQIEFEEFLRSLSVSTRGKLEERLSWAFSLYDLDRDGFITFEEMATLVGSLYKLMGGNHQSELTAEERVQAIFQAMDVNNDGRISREEFTSTSMRNPELLNTFLMYQGLV
jgi:Ca2+-binding EF-hand superfamily protein